MRNYIIIGLSVLILLLIFFKIHDNNSKMLTINPLNSIDSSEIKEITIYNPAVGFVITEQGDIKTLVKLLKSMELKKKKDKHLEGFAFLITITLANKNTISMGILSGDIAIDSQHYSPDKDYCDSIRAVFNKLSEKYQLIQAWLKLFKLS